MKYPLVPICIFFCLGILAAAYLKISFPVFYALLFLFLILSIVFIRQDKIGNIVILCAVLFSGALLLRNSQTLPNCHIANLTPQKIESAHLIGVVASDPVQGKRCASFILRAEELKTDETWQDACGRVLVRVFPDGSEMEKTFFYGDKLLLEGSIFKPFSFSKEFNYRDYLKHKGIYRILNVKKGGLIKHLERNIGNPLKSFAFRVRHRIREIFIENLSPFSADILNAVILGERQNLSSYIREVLVRSGTVHIIAISGLHLGIACFMTLAILKIIGIPRKPRYILAIIILGFYSILTGAQPPVVRATVMAVVLLFGYLLERDVNIYNTLALAALIMLVVNPWQLFEISFQLSFLSVVFIVWLAPKIKSMFSERLHKRAWTRILIQAFSISAAAWLGLMGLIAYYFRILSPVTILANMIIVPYIPLVIASGFILALAGISIPFLAGVIAGSVEFCILILFKINSLLIAIPGAYFKIPHISFAYVLCYYFLLILISIFHFRMTKNTAVR